MEDAPAGQPYIDLTLHGEAFCLLSTFYGSVQIYTSPEIYTTIWMVSKKMLDNTSSKMVMSGVC